VKQGKVQTHFAEMPATTTERLVIEIVEFTWVSSAAKTMEYVLTKLA